MRPGRGCGHHTQIGPVAIAHVHRAIDAPHIRLAVVRTDLPAADGVQISEIRRDNGNGVLHDSSFNAGHTAHHLLLLRKEFMERYETVLWAIETPSYRY